MIYREDMVYYNVLLCIMQYIHMLVIYSVLNNNMYDIIFITYISSYIKIT